jgi:protein SCO1/2
VGRYIAEPDKMLAEKDPIAVELFAKYKNVRMPNLDLSAEDVALLLSHIETESIAVARAQAGASVRPASLNARSP